MKTNPTLSARGIVPPLVTPLTQQGQIDIAGLECLIEHIIAGGVHGLFVLGTTGEGPSLSYDLRQEMIRQTCRIADSRLPVFAGITDTVLKESVSLARFAAEAGCSFVVAAPPYYFPLNQSELLAYFKQLMFEVPLPMMLYNMPAVTGVTIGKDIVKQLLDQEMIVGLKDSSGDLEYFQEILRITSTRKDFSVMVGPEHLLSKCLALGGNGGVTGGANIFPELFVNLYESVIEGKQFDTASLATAIATLGAIYKVGPVSVTATIARIKASLSICQICGDTTAPPIERVNPTERKRIRNILAQLGKVSDQSHSELPKPQIA